MQDLPVPAVNLRGPAHDAGGGSSLGSASVDAEDPSSPPRGSRSSHTADIPHGLPEKLPIHTPTVYPFE